MSLTTRILLAMGLGLLVGIVFKSVIAGGGEFGQWLQLYMVEGVFDVVGQIFVKSLKLLVVPLVLVSLICGSGALGEQGRVGPMAGKTVGLYLLTTCIAISFALLAATMINPGAGMDLPTASDYVAKEAPPFKQVLIDIFPSNPVASMSAGNMLQIIVFALLFGISMSRAGEAGKRLLSWFEDVNEVIMKMVMMLMNLAPYGVFCLLAKLFSGLGFDGIHKLAAYFFTVFGVLVLHGIVVYPTLLRIFGGLNPLIFLSKLRPLMMFAFSTSSSNASIPVTLRTAEERLGVDNRIASFTVPLGATINMDGTAVMQGVATVFIAQAYGLDIGLTGYLMVILTATMASIGTAGVPGVGLITLALVLEQAGLPVEGIALIIGVDRLLDMARTVVNVTGDSAVTAIVAKSEGALDKECFDSPAKPMADH
ncbi:dicarboxylate/amino acid:cation symporter [Pseudoteredinibacter isoporae]|uniref:Na+/H+-dicarboxylate symporter n=1 Tax=Pseudoteredinibacter isoporae TaxID=570281 RepID=A0A7X0MVX8_9GAMM|nr:dicarboxylate/amino acid:cation symporter [Pseudoteredinibacter isoporae]MBB6520309.1 Na+/H+-dicarboxylate symporter [Pseudoteredinibacter isoporae]NHO85880.1 dicarboxylate/amino acid:cation symporter [Pseudoteredinibacter isoporae]NIB25668.1 dicarboxylate/amino acid:cation symporter [Pseudoteredinibacter isoporae]